jgi:hypothetical protein
MCIFEKYKDIFGKPNTGIHAYRLFDFAIIDIIGTLIIAYLIGKYFSFDNNNILKLFIIIFLIGEIFHLLFCVKTKFIQILDNFFST